MIGSRLFTPTEILPFTIGWYDGSDADTITQETGGISQWADKGLYARHLLQSSQGIRPSYALNAINNLNVVWYQNTFDEMQTDLFASVDCSQVAMISVGMPKTAGDYPNFGRIRSTDDSDLMAVRFLCQPTVGGFSSRIKLDGVQTNNSTPQIYPELAEEVAFITSDWYDGADYISRVNGGTQTVTSDVADGVTFTVNEIQVGRDSNTPRNYHGEMLVLSTANLSIIQKCEGYLAWKWGLVSALSALHPYKNSRPFA
jgi:hypothetical protein